MTAGPESQLLDKLKMRADRQRLARSWFTDPDRRQVSVRYDQRETRLPYSLCLHVGLAMVTRPISRVLDVGCGGGEILAEAARLLPDTELVGVDPSPEAVAAARHRLSAQPRCQVWQMAAEDLARQEGAELGDFDFVTVFGTLMLWDDPLVGMTAIAKALRPGGTCYGFDLVRPTDDLARAISTLAPADDDEAHYLRDVLAAALSVEEGSELMEAVAAATDVTVELGLGGLGGYPPQSPQAKRIRQSSTSVQALLRQIKDTRTYPKDGTHVWHLWLRRP